MLNRLIIYMQHHRRAFIDAITELKQQALGSLLTILVITVTLALPFSLLSILKGFKNIGNNAKPFFSVYINNPAANQIPELTAQLTQLTNADAIQYISPQQGLKEFTQFTKTQNLLKQLPQNPLPGVFVITPSLNQSSAAAIQGVVDKIKSLPSISSVQFNTTWVTRLYTLLQFARRFSYALTAVFGIGILLIIGNTIRLTTEKNQENIQIMRLLGATKSFIRRPILYKALIISIISGVFAWLGMSMLLSWLAKPLDMFMATYQQTLSLPLFTLSTAGNIIAISIGLSLAGSWLAIQPYLFTKE